MSPMSNRWPLLLIVVLALCSASSSATAQGPLRRLLFGPPCPAAPPVCVQIAPALVAEEQWGSLQGRVVWKGELPKVESLEPKIRNHPDAAAVLKAPKEQLLDPTWRIDPKSKGIANVCVFLKRPKDGILPIHPDDKVRKEPVVIDAPFCIYVPHMVAVYPEWFDGKNRGETGQKLITRNSSQVAQATRVVGGPQFGRFMPANRLEESHALAPKNIPYSVDCDIHVWMRAYAFVFDHPYFAITKADGKFTIPRVPADMEVQLMAWHESQGWLLTKDGKTVALKKGKNTFDFEMSAK